LVVLSDCPEGKVYGTAIQFLDCGNFFSTTFDIVESVLPEICSYAIVGLALLCSLFMGSKIWWSMLFWVMELFPFLHDNHLGLSGIEPVSCGVLDVLWYHPQVNVFFKEPFSTN
jgi:hypothetical protein